MTPPPNSNNTPNQKARTPPLSLATCIEGEHSSSPTVLPAPSPKSPNSPGTPREPIPGSVMNDVFSREWKNPYDPNTPRYHMAERTRQEMIRKEMLRRKYGVEETKKSKRRTQSDLVLRTSLSGDIEALRKELKAKENELEDNKRLMKIRDAELAAYKAKFELQSRQTPVKQQQQAAASRNNSTTELAQLKQNYERLQQHFEEKYKYIAELEAKISQEREALKTEKETFDLKYEMQAQEHKKMLEQCEERFNLEKEELLQQIAQLHSQISALEAVRRQLDGWLTLANAEKDQLQQDNATLSAKLGAALAENARLQESVLIYQQQQKESEERIRLQEQQLSALMAMHHTKTTAEGDQETKKEGGEAVIETTSATDLTREEMQEKDVQQQLEEQQQQPPVAQQQEIETNTKEIKEEEITPQSGSEKQGSDNDTDNQPESVATIDVMEGLTDKEIIERLLDTAEDDPKHDIGARITEEIVSHFEKEGMYELLVSYITQISDNDEDPAQEPVFSMQTKGGRVPSHVIRSYNSMEILSSAPTVRLSESMDCNLERIICSFFAALDKRSRCNIFHFNRVLESIIETYGAARITEILMRNSARLSFDKMILDNLGAPQVGNALFNLLLCDYEHEDNNTTGTKQKMAFHKHVATKLNLLPGIINKITALAREGTQPAEEVCQSATDLFSRIMMSLSVEKVGFIMIKTLCREVEESPSLIAGLFEVLSSSQYGYPFRKCCVDVILDIIRISDTSNTAGATPQQQRALQKISVTRQALSALHTSVLRQLMKEDKLRALCNALIEQETSTAPFSTLRLGLVQLFIVLLVFGNKDNPDDAVGSSLLKQERLSSVWSILVQWFFKHRHNNIYHNTFCKIVFELLRQSAHNTPKSKENSEALIALLQANNFFTTAISMLSATEGTTGPIDNRGHMLILLDSINKQARLLDHEHPLHSFLENCSEWKQFCASKTLKRLMKRPRIGNDNQDDDSDDSDDDDNDDTGSNDTSSLSPSYEEDAEETDGASEKQQQQQQQQGTEVMISPPPTEEMTPTTTTETAPQEQQQQQQ